MVVCSQRLQLFYRSLSCWFFLGMQNGETHIGCRASLAVIYLLRRPSDIAITSTTWQVRGFPSVKYHKGIWHKVGAVTSFDFQGVHRQKSLLQHTWDPFAKSIPLYKGKSPFCLQRFPCGLETGWGWPLSNQGDARHQLIKIPSSRSCLLSLNQGKHGQHERVSYIG